MSVRIGIAGAAGRMGKRLVALTLETAGCALSCALERTNHPALGQDAGVLAGVKSCGIALTTDLAVADATEVLIDFTLPEGCVLNAQVAAERGIALVIGTTGLNDEQRAVIAACAKKVPVIHAPNFSVGVNVLFKISELVARTLGDDYQIEIVEAHHDQKVDAPSGTALGLAKSIAAGLNRNLDECAIYGRKGIIGVRSQQEIAIHTLRMGDVVGEHTAYFAIGGERLELTHKATSRDTFARGAIRAAHWLIRTKKSAGFYRISEVLGLD